MAIIFKSVVIFMSLVYGLSFEGDFRMDHSDNVTEMLDNLLKKYDQRLRPYFGGKPVMVNVTLNVDSIGPIDEVEMKFRIDISFRQYWMDPRLMFSPKFDDLTLSDKFLDKIWQPDTYFPESYESKKQKVMVPNILLRISSSGVVLLSSRVTVVAKCPMDLLYFPMDSQKCMLIIEAYGYTIKDLQLNWLINGTRNPVQYPSSALKLAQFSLINCSTESYVLEFTTGSFSDLQVNFYFKRLLSYYLIQTYLPATLIVILSWVSFWVNRSAIPARAALAITTVLTMMTLMGSTNSALPKVSRIKALDVFFGISFFYVFGALGEFALICYFNKPRFNNQDENGNKQKECCCNHNHNDVAISIREEKCATPNCSVTTGDYQLMVPTSNASNMNVLRPQLSNSKPRKSVFCSKIEVSRIDFFSRIIFPLSYLMIQVVYWTVYMQLSKSAVESV